MRALISVWDKTDLDELARGLTELGWELVASGKTATHLAELGLVVTPVEEVTASPEMLGGRVKTLHPRIHAGILARRDLPDDVSTLDEHEIEPFDLVCVNLYPFEQVAAQRGVGEAEAVEMIDVGGPSMLRGAAKNFAHVAALSRPAQYEPVLAELRENGEVALDTRRRLAAEAFAATARYEAAIARWFSDRETFPDTLIASFTKVLDLAYGENPHQRAAYYAEDGARRHLLSRVDQLHGRDLSLINLYDLSAAELCLREFTLPACVIVKHANPCGVAVGTTIEEAYGRALAADPLSAFGMVCVLNRPVGAELGERLAERFIDVLLAPDYEPAALVQDRDFDVDDREGMEVVAGNPSEECWGDLLFAWRVCKHVTSNAIVLAKDLQTIGIGGGQTSRVDSVKIAIEKAREHGHDLAGAALASDAFFPFADGPQAAIDAGVTALIQPGGSKRDAEVIAAVEAAGATMVFSGRRHFRH